MYTLIRVQDVELHKVHLGRQELLRRGEFIVYVAGQYGHPHSVHAQVADVVWPLRTDLPALKASPHVFSFEVDPPASDTFYVVVLPAGLPTAEVEATADIIEGATAFSTVKQLDAAYEEADALTGGKEAAAAATDAQAVDAAAAAAAAGAPPSAAAAALVAPAAQPPPLPQLPRTGSVVVDRVASGVLLGGRSLAEGIARVSSRTSERISSFSETQKRSAQPCEAPVKVSPAARAGLAVAGVAATGAVAVTGVLASAVGAVSNSIALGVAGALSSSGKKGKRGGGGAEARSGDSVCPEQHGAMKTIGAAGLLAYVEVYDSLEAAAKLVLANSGDAATDYLGYKYGDEARAAATSSLPVMQNMLTAVLNLSRLSARAFVTKTAKRTAKMWLKDTLAGLTPAEQAAGQRVPSILQQGASGNASSSSYAAAAVGAPPPPPPPPALPYTTAYPPAATYAPGAYAGVQEPWPQQQQQQQLQQPYPGVMPWV